MDVKKNYDKKTATVSDKTKNKTVYTVSVAPGGFIFYNIKPSVGSLPAELSGRYSSLDKAVDAVSRYLELSEPTVTAGIEQAVARNKKGRAKENAATVKSEDG